MLWSAPTVAAESVNIDATLAPTLAVPASDDSQRSTYTAFENCYDGGNDCVTTGAYDTNSNFRFRVLGGTYANINTSANNWISFDGSALSINPTDPTLVGTYEIAATY